MKKRILILMITLIAFFPCIVKAEENEYHSMNLEQALTEEGIEHDLSGYTETDDQAIIYLFRGSGCGYCKRFLTFLNSIVPEYGKYFKVVSYEVWQETENRSLLNGFSKTLEVEVKGVPFIIIGNEYFPGYASTYDEQIKKAIMEQYENKNKDNLIATAIQNAGGEGYTDPTANTTDNENGESYNKATSNESSTTDTSSILWNLVFVITGTGIILIVNYIQYKRLEEKLDYVMLQLNKQKKAKKD